MKYSTKQVAIFNDVESGKGHTVIQARAGTGKTTTIVKALEYVPKGKSVLAVAFNKSIATELAGRVPRGVDVSTLHSFGNKALYRAFGKTRLDSRKSYRILDSAPETKKLARAFKSALVKVVSLAKGCLAETEGDLEAIAWRHEIDLEPEQEREFFRLAHWLLNRSKAETHVIDFDDMIWFPIVLGLPVRQYDRIFVDETQDMNPCQLELVMRACKRHGRITVIGDDRQAIYGFRGADENAMGAIRDRLSAKTLPLSTTYRCAKRIVEVAQTIVPDYEADARNPEGVVREARRETMIAEAREGDFILSRVNAPLVSACLALLKQGTRANVAGRDLGEQLAGIVKRSNCEDTGDLCAAVQGWAERESERLLKRDPEASTESIWDRAECIFSLCEGASAVAEVLSRIEALFSDVDDSRRVVLSTTHKAKGLERDRVWLLRETYLRRKTAEEENLFYVAVTRARHELVFVYE